MDSKERLEDLKSRVAFIRMDIPLSSDGHGMPRAAAMKLRHADALLGQAKLYIDEAMDLIGEE